MAITDTIASGSLNVVLYQRSLQTAWPVPMVYASDNFPLGLAHNPAPSGPYFKVGGTGKRYVVLQDTLSSVRLNRVLVLSSSDGLNWAEEHPSAGVFGVLMWSEFATSVGTHGTIYVGYKDGQPTVDGAFYIRPFDCASGLWGTTVTGGPTLQTKTGLTYLNYGRNGVFTRLSNGHLIAAYQKVVSNKPKTKYQIHNGTSWSADVDIDPYGDASAQHTFPIGIDHDSSDITYFYIGTPTGTWYFTQEIFLRTLAADESTLGTLYRVQQHVQDFDSVRVPYGPSYLSGNLMALPVDLPHANVLTGSPPRPEGYAALSFAAVSQNPAWKTLLASVTQRTEYGSSSAIQGRGGSVAGVGTSLFLAWPERVQGTAGSLVISRCEGVDQGGQFGPAVRVYRQLDEFGQSSAGIVGESQDRIGVLFMAENPGGYNTYYWEGDFVPAVLTPCPETEAVGALYRIK